MHDSPARPHHDFAFSYPGSELTDDEVEFGRAMHAYQRRHNVRYPAWSDILFVLRSLGYRKQNSTPTGNAEDADSLADRHR